MQLRYAAVTSVVAEVSLLVSQLGPPTSFAIPGARQAWVPGAGPFLAEDNPQETSEALLESLAEPTARTD
jgi:hypothetical protein